MDISVVIPAYNREATIERAVMSILNQTILPTEIIVVDDCSTDSTAAIVQKLRRENSLVKLIRLKKNQGAQVARNCGIKIAKGNWIAFLDSDDEWLENKLEIQQKAVEENPEFDVFYGDYYIKKNDRIHYRYCKMKGRGGHYFESILFGSLVLFQGMLIRKKALEDIGLMDKNVPSYQEWDTNIRLSEKHKYYYINKPLFVYNLHNGETISKDQNKKIIGFQYVIVKNCNLFLEDNIIDRSISFYYKGMYLRYKESGSWKSLYYFCFEKLFIHLLKINMLKPLCKVVIKKRWQNLNFRLFHNKRE